MKHEPGIRLYGVSIGQSSNARVTAGIRGALEELGMLSGFVPIDWFDEDETFPGAMAESGLLVGPYTNVRLLRHGFHERRYAIVAPNSTWLPQSLVEMMDRHAIAVAPSSWAAEILGNYLENREAISVWPHGVEDQFRVDDESHERLSAQYESGHFKVLHLSSSALQRKGTKELIVAWGRLLREVCHEGDWQLDISLEAPDRELEREAFDRCPSGSIQWVGKINGSPECMAGLYQRYHLVCQPSRGEGFGMVPLEARCCGVPVCMTGCTGHAEHLGLRSESSRHGVVVVQTGPLEDIDDGPGAMAPSLAPEQVLGALFESHAKWGALHRASLACAQKLRHAWSWKCVTEKWLREENDRVKNTVG